jgi:hypothetical protein
MNAQHQRMLITNSFMLLPKSKDQYKSKDIRQHGKALLLQVTFLAGKTIRHN